MTVANSNQGWSYDIEVDLSANPGDVGQKVVEHLGYKGFCAVRMTGQEALFGDVLEDVRLVDGYGSFVKTHTEIADGLLGPNGSGRHARLSVKPSENPPILQELNDSMTLMADAITDWAPTLGFQTSVRTVGLLHEARTSQTSLPDLSEDEVGKWLETFRNHRIMILVFLGPAKGTLELQPFDDEGNAIELTTESGMMVVLRADTLWHTHQARDRRGYVLSCFLMQSGSLRMPSIPIVEMLDMWSRGRLEEYSDDPKKLEKHLEGVDSKTLWRYQYDHTYRHSNACAVRGMACKFPSTWDPVALYKATVPGVDTVGGVPLARWDHTTYYEQDPQDEWWTRFKVTTFHGGFCEGLDLFDARFFRIAPAEVKSMDPMQRMILDAGYESLMRAGKTQKQLLQSLTGVYVGCQVTEILIIPQLAQESGGCDQRAAGTGFASAIMSNRVSFVLGMMGPSVTIDTDAASALTAIQVGMVALMPGKGGADMITSMGCSIMLSPLTWIGRCRNGEMGKRGRSFTYDVSADGYVRSEGVGAVAFDLLMEKVDDKYIEDETKPNEAVFRSSLEVHSGLATSLHAPYAPSQQRILSELMRMGSIAPTSVDNWECHGDGKPLFDCCEFLCLNKMLCADIVAGNPVVDNKRVTLLTASTKTNYGNAIHSGGMPGVLRMIQGTRYGLQQPNVHLRQLNPNMPYADAIDEWEYGMGEDEYPAAICMESCLLPNSSSLSGVTGYGFGGTLSALLIVNKVNESMPQMPPRNVPFQRAGAAIAFWPGGGGEIDEAAAPRRGYFIVGSWSSSDVVSKMEQEAQGIFGYDVTLGANRFETFQICLDGDRERVLHPGYRGGHSGAMVMGPSPLLEAQNCVWTIDGRVSIAKQAAIEDENDKPSDAKPLVMYGSLGGGSHGYNVTETARGLGDTYHVRLQVHGKWRSVSWERTEQAMPGDGVQSIVEGLVQDPAIAGKYYLSGSFNNWGFLELDAGSDGTFAKELKVLQTQLEFQVIRNKDLGQIFHPPHDEATAFMAAYGGRNVSFSSKDVERKVLGPDSDARGLSWCVKSRPGDIVRVEFRRALDLGSDRKFISIETIRTDALSNQEEETASRPSYGIIGTWSGWESAHEMKYDGDTSRGTYEYTVKVGTSGSESFQILVDGRWHVRLYPNTANAGPESQDSRITGVSSLRGPDSQGHGRNWMIKLGDEDQPGARYVVKLLVENRIPKRVFWE